MLCPAEQGHMQIAEWRGGATLFLQGPPAAGLTVCPEERGHMRVASGAQVVLRRLPGLPDEPC